VVMLQFHFWIVCLRLDADVLLFSCQFSCSLPDDDLYVVMSLWWRRSSNMACNIGAMSLGQGGDGVDGVDVHVY
jgi:hypothetical protein